MSLRHCYICGCLILQDGKNTKYCISCSYSQRKHVNKRYYDKKLAKNSSIHKVCKRCGKDFVVYYGQKFVNCILCRRRKTTTQQSWDTIYTSACVECGINISPIKQAKKKYCTKCMKQRRALLAVVRRKERNDRLCSYKTLGTISL